MLAMAATTVETWDVRTLTPAQARAIGQFVYEVWPRPNVTVEDRVQQLLSVADGYRGSERQAPKSFVIRDGDRVLAHSQIYARAVRTTDVELVIGALARVGTVPEQRGKGLGETIARAALGAVDRGDFPFALFQTSNRVRPFYEKLGAVAVQNPLINSLAEGPKGNPFWDEVVMRYPAHGAWPAGTIDLRGPGY
jgi:predicted N-acetyltransferase YhbS